MQSSFVGIFVECRRGFRAVVQQTGSRSIAAFGSSYRGAYLLTEDTAICPDVKLTRAHNLLTHTDPVTARMIGMRKLFAVVK
jgi:hypothetical protein